MGEDQNDIAPPWAEYPHYERYTIGWRMGSGEAWLDQVWALLERLADDRAARLAWLRRHPPAPFTWADWIVRILGDVDEDGDDELDAAALAALEREGLIAADAAYEIYVGQGRGAEWPWEWAESPIVVARHWTRELAFWSRYRAATPAAAVPWREVPEPWQAFARKHAGVSDAPAPPLTRGLEALAWALASGWPPAPWACGLELASFRDSFEDDMGYADAFRLWLMSGFDDRPTLAEYARTQPPAPGEWAAWLAEQLDLPGAD